LTAAEGTELDWYGASGTDAVRELLRIAREASTMTPTIFPTTTSAWISVRWSDGDAPRGYGVYDDTGLRSGGHATMEDAVAAARQFRQAQDALTVADLVSSYGSEEDAPDEALAIARRFGVAYADVDGNWRSPHQIAGSTVEVRRVGE
jgi:D-serine deaminase-like pyridoxal phosphate-dependent protein